MRKIRWKDLCSSGEALHASYASQPTGGSWQLHGHDFCEVFWVDSGVGHHFLDEAGPPQRLVAGQLCFIRERDFHGFSAESSHEPFACINIAFPTRAWNGLRDRYSLAKHPFLNESVSLPPVIEAPAELKRDFSAFFQRVLRRPPDLLSRDAFLLALATRTGGLDIPVAPENLPAWLRRGMMAIENNPGSWSGGPSALARACGCSRTHLARVFRQHLGRKPSDWILDLRLARASRLLASTGFSITDVAFESGFSNLSHFHRCFASRHGRTPLQYRKAVRREAF